MHTLKVFHTCFGDLREAVQHFWLILETFANKKCVNVRYMKLREDFELFGNPAQNHWYPSPLVTLSLTPAGRDHEGREEATQRT